uniref:C2H2-type domain-containing protein n=1 Tax=Macrostomum lignano TaxID=282301 RepID=A0A1I8FE35_9PLAT
VRVPAAHQLQHQHQHLVGGGDLTAYSSRLRSVTSSCADTKTVRRRPRSGGGGGLRDYRCLWIERDQPEPRNTLQREWFGQRATTLSRTWPWITWAAKSVFMHRFDNASRPPPRTSAGPELTDHTCYWQECARHFKPFRQSTSLVNQHPGAHRRAPVPLPVPHVRKKCSPDRRISKFTSELTQCEYDGLRPPLRQQLGPQEATLHVHMNDKPYYCRVGGCDKSYTHPSSLRKHMRVAFDLAQRPSERTGRTAGDGKGGSGQVKPPTAIKQRSSGAELPDRSGLRRCQSREEAGRVDKLRRNAIYFAERTVARLRSRDVEPPYWASKHSRAGRRPASRSRRSSGGSSRDLQGFLLGRRGSRGRLPGNWRGFSRAARGLRGESAAPADAFSASHSCVPRVATQRLSLGSAGDGGSQFVQLTQFMGDRVNQAVPDCARLAAPNNSSCFVRQLLDNNHLCRPFLQRTTKRAWGVGDIGDKQHSAVREAVNVWQNRAGFGRTLELRPKHKVLTSADKGPVCEGDVAREQLSATESDARRPSAGPATECWRRCSCRRVCWHRVIDAELRSQRGRSRSWQRLGNWLRAEAVSSIAGVGSIVSGIGAPSAFQKSATRKRRRLCRPHLGEAGAAASGTNLAPKAGSRRAARRPGSSGRRGRLRSEAAGQAGGSGEAAQARRASPHSGGCQGGGCGSDRELLRRPGAAVVQAGWQPDQPPGCRQWKQLALAHQSPAPSEQLECW